MKAKRYYGEEAQQMTKAECEALDQHIAKLNSGELNWADVVEEAPNKGEITAYVVQS